MVTEYTGKGVMTKSASWPGSLCTQDLTPAPSFIHKLCLAVTAANMESTGWRDEDGTGGPFLTELMSCPLIQLQERPSNTEEGESWRES